MNETDFTKASFIIFFEIHSIFFLLRDFDNPWTLTPRHCDPLQLIWLYKISELIDPFTYLFIYLQKIERREFSKYTLYGVIVHTGGLTGGHYYAYVKRLESDKWELCDDGYVHRVDIEEVLRSKAYILFYHKIDKFFKV